jgi:uncharacterized cupredoxin-like copper-binding protein
MRMDVQRKILGLLAAVVLVGGCGGGSHDSHSSSGKPARTVNVVMKDIAYDPSTVTVKAGETVRFVFHNEGQIRHDAFIGDEAAQADHEKEMREAGSDGKDGHHGDDAITVDPGDTGTLTHTFKAGEALIIGCHEVGHYAAGMKITVTVT